MLYNIDYNHIVQFVSRISTPPGQVANSDAYMLATYCGWIYNDYVLNERELM
jgi:hypothetical protein